MSLGEHGEDKFEHDAGRGQFLFEENAAEQGPEKSINEVLRKSFLCEEAFCGEFLMGVELVRISEEEAAFKESDADRVAKIRIRKAERIEECFRIAERVGELVQVFSIPDTCTRDKVTQLEGIQIECLFDLWVGGLEDLESVIEAETVLDGGPDPAADCISGLKDADCFASLMKECGGAQAGHAGPDYYDIAICLSIHWLGE